MNVDYGLKRTQMLTDTCWVDLATINGVLKTQIFEKESEPNNYGLVREEDGDKFDEIVKEFSS